MTGMLVKVIRAYQFVLSPMLGSHCRFHPSCSQYALESLETHGLFKGLALALRRLVKCQPFHTGGFDPVPPASHSSLDNRPL
ncbi:MAG TPA: membrane protein insertion efficiency factor YidD [Porticoccaceae bacterium]|nr:membrane protein insertion efficiency factor YidD [Porticoccaceae bacterium]